VPIISCPVPVVSGCQASFGYDTIDELKIDVEDPDELFGAMLEAALCGNIMVNSGHRLTLLAICAALGNPELPESIWNQLGDDAMRENVVDRLRFLSATRCNISREVNWPAE
jgi:hypothetical protein